jgi:hypothetical protein
VSNATCPLAVEPLGAPTHPHLAVVAKAAERPLLKPTLLALQQDCCYSNTFGCCSRVRWGH